MALRFFFPRTSADARSLADARSRPPNGGPNLISPLIPPSSSAHSYFLSSSFFFLIVHHHHIPSRALPNGRWCHSHRPRSYRQPLPLSAVVGNRAATNLPRRLHRAFLNSGVLSPLSAAWVTSCPSLPCATGLTGGQPTTLHPTEPTLNTHNFPIRSPAPDPPSNPQP